MCAQSHAHLVVVGWLDGWFCMIYGNLKLGLYAYPETALTQPFPSLILSEASTYEFTHLGTHTHT